MHVRHYHRWHPHPCMSRRHEYRRRDPIANYAGATLAGQGDQTVESKFLSLLKSRKFWAAVIGLALIVARNLIPNFLPFGDQDITAVVLVLISYILGTALEDAGSMYARARK